MSTSGKGGVYFNNNRIAEIWLDDESKEHYYKVTGPNNTREFGDISERLELKERLNCKPFTWFLNYVHPKIKEPTDYDSQRYL